MEIHRADPQLRRMVALLVIAAVVVGAAILWFFRQWLSGLAQLPTSAAYSQLISVLAWCMALACLSLFVFAVYLWRLGARVVSHAQLPIPGARLLRDTPIVRGALAQRRGRWLQGLSAALFACAAGLAVVAWRVLQALASKAV